MNLNDQGQRPQQYTLASTSDPLTTLETLMREHITRTEAIVQGNSSSIRALEVQLGKLASNLNTRPPGSLPSDTENPSLRGKEHCKAITLRSSK